MKKFFLLLLFFSISSAVLFAQESQASDNDEIDYEGFDDFDSIFEDAQDLEEPLLEEESEPENKVQAVASAFSNMVHFSGSFSGDVGLLYMHRKGVNEAGEEDNDDFSGFFSLKNTLNMSIIPSPVFTVHGSLDTGIDNGFTLAVSSLYFNYLLLNRLYISAGKKGISWGNVRLFNSTGYYGCETHSGCLYSTGPAHANIFAEDGAALALDIKYPWAWGTLTFAITGNATSKIKPDSFNYYGSLEFSALNTNFNIYVKRPAKNPAPGKSNLAGLEIKRTILGFDTYAQGIVRVNNLKDLKSKESWDYVVATAGLYRLFDSFDPNIGFNLEYQYEYSPASPDQHNNRIAFEGGLKRIGKNKNMKIGVISHYSITEKHGFSALNFIVSGILPYADWSTKVGAGYGSKYEIPAFLMSSSLSLALDY